VLVGGGRAGSIADGTVDAATGRGTSVSSGPHRFLQDSGGASPGWTTAGSGRDRGTNRPVRSSRERPGEPSGEVRSQVADVLAARPPFGLVSGDCAV